VEEGSKFFSTFMQFYRLVSLCFSCCINNEINFILLVLKFFIIIIFFSVHSLDKTISLQRHAPLLRLVMMGKSTLK